MTDDKRIYLKDYQTPNYWIRKTHLHVSIFDDVTRVQSSLHIERNGVHNEPLILDGEAMTLTAINVDGVALDESQYTVDESTLEVHQLPQSFQLQTVVEIKPELNKTLSGLYESKGMYCTQCEAQGFRRITYYLDRPDVLSEFITTIDADKAQYPVLLSNGNKINEVDLDQGRHQVTWHDPHPKPCYLFALVAGDLACKEDVFTTVGGRNVDLRFYVEPKDLDKLDHGIASLKASMKWDEEVYGREYDLNNYMVVAVSHFNMGAMENKGLNIFNTSCVLADPDNATDASYQRVEGVIAHEYFHNWSGNRVTCRDWFQLSLKEGFTVFRDAQFTSDMNSETVKRIEDVNILRTMQFAEDAGPQAHPIRPDSYIAIDNFYTMTVYEKGAEVIRMMRVLLGWENFRKGSDLYFGRHDGSAATCDDFVQAMEDASGDDLTQFKNWYSQSGTPSVKVNAEYDAEQQTYTLHFAQSCAPTPGQETKAPFVIPVELALFDGSGDELALLPEASKAEASKGENAALRGNQHSGHVFVLSEPEQSITFTGIACKPIPSLLRGFSAPVNLSFDYKPAEYALLMQCESNGFNRWQAGQAWAEQLLQAEIKSGETLSSQRTAYVSALSRVLADKTVDAAVKAEMLRLPSDNLLLETQQPMRVTATAEATDDFMAFIGRELGMQLEAIYHVNFQANYEVNAEAIAKRRLKNNALILLLAGNASQYWSVCVEQLESANNLTDRLAALDAMVRFGYNNKSTHFDAFYQTWQHEDLIVDRWFALQTINPRDDVLAEVEQLLEHPAFAYDNPNRLRSVIGSFCRFNFRQFYREDGKGFELLADVLRKVDAINPQMAARLAGFFNSWRKLPNTEQQPQQAQVKALLESLLASDLSKNTYEILNNALNWQG